MARLLLFDVNETLLDMGALDPHFARAFADTEARREWFLTLQGLWLTGIATGSFTPFEKLARAALEMTAARRGRELSAELRRAILDGMKTLPPHAEVHGVLADLHAEGFRMAALTNGAPKAARQQLAHAGLAPFLEAVFSAEEVERHKPAPEPYRMAVKRLGLRAKDVRLVAAHAWDIAGAAAAGLRTAFVTRPGKVANPAGPKADFKAADLAGLSRHIRRHDEPTRRA